MCEKDSNANESDSYKGAVSHSGTMVDRQSSAVGPDGVAEVECELNHRSSHHFPARGEFDDKMLLWRGHCKQPSAA